MLRRGIRVLARMVSLHPVPFAIGVFGAAVYGVATVATSRVMGWITDHVVVPRFDEGDVATGTMVTGVVLVLAVGLIKAAGIVTRRIGATVAMARIGATLRSQVASRYQLVPYEFHQRTPTGELLAHADADVEAAADSLAPVPFSLGVGVIFITSMVWLVVTDLWLALVGFVVFPLVIAVNLIYQRVVEEPVERAQELVGQVSAIAHESFDGDLIVKALGAEGIESERFRAKAAELQEARIQVARLRATFETTLDALPTMAIVALLLLGAWRVDQGVMTPGTVVAFVSLFTLLTWPLRLIGYVLGNLPRAVVGYDRIQTILAEPVDPRHERSAGSATRITTPSVDGARLVLDGLSFRYEPDRPVLSNVSAEVKPGTRVALVGPTGSGKSTLVLLVAGLLTPTGGAVRIDGRPLADLTVDELRAEIGVAFQEPFLFSDTVHDNIEMANGVETHDAVVAAAALAGAHQFVTRLPDGYETVVGERGATLSGGQRQRVALARALARRPRLLLLDDATSAVDPTTEAAILAALSDRLRGTTTLVVASRPSTIALADEVIYLEEGRVVAHGTPTELLARVPGYERLVRAYELDRADREAMLT